MINHPVADLFPMLADDELAELAADISERGLLQPVVLDAEGRVLDGRNRLAACEMAEIEPSFITYDGDDADGYALAVNIQRRNLTKGQIAMVAAKAFATNGFIYGEKQRSSKAAGISASRVRTAKVVLESASDLVDAVISGATSLDAAYETARERKKAAESNEARMATLRAAAPDLADQVTEERLSLGEAIAAWQERDRKSAEQRRDARDLLKRAVDLVAPESMSNGWVNSWAEHLHDCDDIDVLAKRAEQAANILLDLVERIRQ